MTWLKLVVLSAVCAGCWCGVLDFPPGFKFGAATSAYQVEGAWNVSDKSPSIWDTYTHSRHDMFRGSTGDVACDSYHLWNRDVEMAKELGLHFYRFSISWSRLLPSGFVNHISKDGSEYYNNLINGLLAHGIEPVVTLYHWDLPQSLQDLGGWTNPLIADWFEAYAKVAFTLYGDRVKTWITINEPIVVCDLSYRTGRLAPGIMSPYIGPLLCTKHVLLGHAKAFRVYDYEFRDKYKGKLSIGNHMVWYEPYSDEDREITDVALAYTIGRYADPIYSRQGGWPPLLEKAMADLSAKQGFEKSILPEFTEEEKSLIQGTYDYLAFNHYTSRLVRKSRPDETSSGQEAVPLEPNPELGYQFEYKDWPIAKIIWLRVYPEGLRRLLVWLKERYGDIPYFITENGLATAGYGLEDDDRVSYYREYLKQVLLAVNENGVRVTGYTAWTIMDNFEWVGDAYETKFGLYGVDFTTLERKPRKSARFYQQVIINNSLNVTIPDKIIKK